MSIAPFWHVTTGQALGAEKPVGLEAEVLASRPDAGAAEAGGDLVEEEDVVAAADVGDRGEVAGRRKVDARSDDGPAHAQDGKPVFRPVFFLLTLLDSALSLPAGSLP
jgi:hypothetical protein